jgi:malonyl-CoA O-methyltransferase
MPQQAPSKRSIANTFANKATGYSRHATIQRIALNKLAGLISSFRLTQTNIFDFGCGTGMLNDIFAEQKIAPTITGIDLSRTPLSVYCSNHPNTSCIIADIEHLPLKNNTIPNAVVASVLQWVSDITIAINELSRVLEPDGHLFFSIFLDGTCNELCALREKSNLPNPAHYVSPKDLNILLRDCGLTVVFTEYMHETLYFSSARDILKSISNIGGTAVAGPHLTRKQLSALCAAYEETYATPNGIPVTYCMAVGVARKLHM